MQSTFSAAVIETADRSNISLVCLISAVWSAENTKKALSVALSRASIIDLRCWTGIRVLNTGYNDRSKNWRNCTTTQSDKCWSLYNSVVYVALNNGKILLNVTNWMSQWASSLQECWISSKSVKLFRFRTSRDWSKQASNAYVYVAYIRLLHT